MKRAIIAVAAILLLGLGFLFLLGASRHRTELALENAVETLYKADPTAADGMLSALLEDGQ